MGGYFRGLGSGWRGWVGYTHWTELEMLFLDIDGKRKVEVGIWGEGRGFLRAGGFGMGLMR